MTGENSTGVIIDQNSSIYSNYYCTSHSDGVCLESITVYSLNQNTIKQIGVEILSVACVFGLSIGLVAWLIKGIFRLIFPGKGRK